MTLPINTYPLIWVLALYSLWVLATYLLAGRPRTLLRPQAIGRRITYIIVANVIIGVVIAGWFLHELSINGVIALSQAGFQNPGHAVIAVIVGTILGLVFFWTRPVPSRNPIVLLNGYALVWATSTAEIIVCWAVVGTTVEAVLQRAGIPAATIIAGLSASLLFSAYHIAHSPPFNSIKMMALLAIIAVPVSLFFFVSRNVYGTIVFHNFFAVFGVLRALDQAGQLKHFERLSVRLLLIAVVSLAALITVQAIWLKP